MTSLDQERLPAFQEQKRQIADQLRRLSAFAGASDAERAAVIGQAATDLERLTFNVAVIGEFNRGKTTLINALLGRPGLLTAAPLPNTAAVTRIVAAGPGTAEHFQVIFRDPLRPPIASDNLADLVRYTTDSHTNNVKQTESIERVELFLDSEFLRRSGITLFDTPGLGAISRAHQDITERIIPTVHAALFVFMIDPPPGAAELSFLRFSQAYINRFLFVMNDKHDLAQQSPLDTAAVIAFARRELATAGIESPPVITMNPGAYLRGADGGFGAFLPVLADFLIEGRGRAQLVDAVRKAEQHIQILDRALIRRMADTDRQTAELQTVLLNMNKQHAALEARRLALLARVDSELHDIVVQLVADIDQLSDRIDRAANDAIDKAGMGTLRVIQLYLPETIQQTVSAWLRDKSAWINARCTALYQRVIADLRELVSDYQAADLAAISIQPTDLPRGIDIALGGDVALALATGLGIAAGVALLDLLTTGGIGAISLVVGGAAGSGTAGAMLMQRIRTSLKTALHQPLPEPNQTRTTLSALIDGYTSDDGQTIAGLREWLTAEFDALSDTVKHQINATVTEAWQPRLNELQTALDQRTSTASGISSQRLALEASRRQLAEIAEWFRTTAEMLGRL